MHVYHVCAWCPQRQKRILHALEVELQITGATLCVLGSKPGPLAEQLTE